MHKFYLLIILLSPFFVNPMVLKAQGKVQSDSSVFAQMEFVESEYNFGDLYQGEKAEHTFTFKNIGKSPLIINNVLTTCGCTVPKWPENPILPGKKGEIIVAFDSSSKIGRQNKVITIRSNAKSGDYHLRISIMVLPQKKE